MPGDAAALILPHTLLKRSILEDCIMNIDSKRLRREPDAVIAQHSRALLADGNETVFDIYDGTVLWDAIPRRIAVDEASTAPLVGVALLDGYALNVQVRGGGVTIRRTVVRRLL